MTYGWALLIVLIAIGALTYYGSFSPENFLPESCRLPPTGIACIDYEATSTIVTVILRNGMGFDLTNVSIAASGCLAEAEGDVENGDQRRYDIYGCDLDVGSKYFGEINVTYSKTQLLYHLVKGQILAKVSEGTPVSENNICQNAETYGLCGGLDIVFGPGYQADCCSEHSLCC